MDNRIINDKELIKVNGGADEKEVFIGAEQKEFYVAAAAAGRPAGGVNPPVTAIQHCTHCGRDYVVYTAHGTINCDCGTVITY